MIAMYLTVVHDPLVREAAAALGRPAWELVTAGPSSRAQALRISIHAPATTILAPATIAAVLRAAAPGLPAGERDQVVTDAATRRSWERPASAVPSGFAPGSGLAEAARDSRYVWMLVLILIGLEWLVRRRRSRSAALVEPAPDSDTHARVA
jgi:hypothetical protein